MREKEKEKGKTREGDNMRTRECYIEYKERKREVG